MVVLGGGAGVGVHAPISKDSQLKGVSECLKNYWPPLRSG